MHLIGAIRVMFFAHWGFWAGWDGDVNVLLTCTHAGCYATVFLLPFIKLKISLLRDPGSFVEPKIFRGVSNMADAQTWTDLGSL